MGSAPWYTTQERVAEYLLSRSRYGDLSLLELEMFLGMHRPKTLRTVHHFERLGLVTTFLKGKRRHVDVNREKLRAYHRRLIRKIAYRQEKKEAMAELGEKMSKKTFKQWREKRAEEAQELVALLSGIEERKPEPDFETEKYLGLDGCRDELRWTYRVFELIRSHPKSRGLFKRWVKDLEKTAEKDKNSVEAAVLANIRSVRGKFSINQRLASAAYLRNVPMARKTLLSIALIGKEHKEIEGRGKKGYPYEKF